jgi:hypothetical protein
MNSNIQKVVYNGTEYDAVVRSNEEKEKTLRILRGREMINPRQEYNLRKEIPSNYTTYQVRAYYMCTVERGFEPSVLGPYATNNFVEDADENYRWTDYTQAKAVFIDALKTSDYFRIELVITTTDEDDDSPHIVVEEWARQKNI